ncbi:hypothetical protein [Micromonospora sp. WMMD1155]|uniref:hypothetical protein n=1 Tax=Micromonospora sp. WMMD1155 TaxID=3016094 RepID=UPI00249BE012|nr:hypothetical protein [Micromonospora sp. WMMD1155]WFE54615.1 hypothetical protein O7617_31600 [Micromonospora sp. WMMD1155]
MRKWIIGGTAGVVVVLIGLVGTLVLLRDTTRFDDRAYSGSSWSKTPDEVFTDFDISLPECAAERMRYWAGSLELYLKVTAPPDCVSQFIEANRLSSSEPLPSAPTGVIRDKRAAEFGWQLPADRVYTWHRREEDNVETQATSDNGATERSLFLHAWHQ